MHTYAHMFIALLLNPNLVRRLNPSLNLLNRSALLVVARLTDVHVRNRNILGVDVTKKGEKDKKKRGGVGNA